MICIAGKNQIAVNVLKFLLTQMDKDKLCVIPNKTDMGIDTWQPSLKFYAQKEQVAIVGLKDIYTVENLIFFSLEFDQIIRPKRFVSCQLYNIHFSLLPKYKGMFTSILPIIHGEKESGVTLHRIDRGIDTGEIIDQLSFSISINDNGRDLYQKYLDHSFTLFKKNIQSILNKEEKSYPQPIEDSSYFSKKTLDFSNLNINYNKTAYEVHNQLRAFCFRDYQLPKFQGVSIYKTSLTNTISTDKPKTVIEENDAFYEITTIDYNIRLFKDYYTELWGSCQENNIEAVKKKLTYIPCIDMRNKKGWNALIIAAYNGHTDLVKYLVEYGADINSTNYKGTSVLMYAKTATVQAGERDMLLLKTVLELGADLKHRDNTGQNVLDYAKRNREMIVLDFLQKKYYG